MHQATKRLTSHTGGPRCTGNTLMAMVANCFYVEKAMAPAELAAPVIKKEEFKGIA
jgi:hypothetical protein